MLFPVSAAQPKIFRAKTRPENAVEVEGIEVDALFRFFSGDIFLKGLSAPRNSAK